MAKTWILSICNSDGGPGYTWRIRGSREDVKNYILEYAADLVREHGPWDGGPMTVDDIDEDGPNGEVMFTEPYWGSFHITISAAEEEAAIDISGFADKKIFHLPYLLEEAGFPEEVADSVMLDSLLCNKLGETFMEKGELNTALIDSMVEEVEI